MSIRATLVNIVSHHIEEYFADGPWQGLGLLFVRAGYLLRCLAKIDLPPTAQILDMPSGFGRHALALASLGHWVVAVDIDEKRLAAVEDSRRDLIGAGDVSCLLADGTRPLPLKAASFDMILVVHFVAEGLTKLLRPLLRPGGYLVFETFAGQGGNWTMLPQPGEMRRRIDEAYDLLDYRESLVGPTRTEAVTVRFLARAR